MTKRNGKRLFVDARMARLVGDVARVVMTMEGGCEKCGHDVYALYDCDGKTHTRRGRWRCSTGRGGCGWEEESMELVGIEGFE